MKIRNKKNGTNTIAYKNGALIKKEIIPAGSVVEISDLTDINQIVNKADFNRGWFEVVSENKILQDKNQSLENYLDKAKKEAEEYIEEESTIAKENKNNKK